MSVQAVRQRHEQSLKAIPGVVGVGHSSDRIIVYVRDEYVISSVPTALDGVPVQCVVTGEVVTL